MSTIDLFVFAVQIMIKVWLIKRENLNHAALHVDDFFFSLELNPTQLICSGGMAALNKLYPYRFLSWHLTLLLISYDDVKL